MYSWQSLIHILRSRVAEKPDEVAFTFISDAGRKETHLTYSELDTKARAISGYLRQFGTGNSGAKDDTPLMVLVVFPAGFEFLHSFFGCLYAGAIAIPTRYPHPKRPLTHLEGIATDSGATIGLTTRELQPVLSQRMELVKWLTVDDVDLSSDHHMEDIDLEDSLCSSDDVAYLQYTSGSTAAPKGVVIHHRHVMANCKDFSVQWGVDRSSRILSWLPHYHDLGLVFGLIESLYAGCQAVFMSPATFAQRPITWLEAVTKYRITHSAAPNFAYERCCQIPSDALSGLDLSTWKTAVNGAEPVRPDTIDRFIGKFESFGFCAEAMCPSYGLAEITLLATANGPGRHPVVRTVCSEGVRNGKFEPVEAGTTAIRLASSGTTQVESAIVVVDPHSLRRVKPGEIGEIWLSGPSVAAGYWKRPQQSTKKFGARLADTHQGPFLRTGDLGIIDNEEVLVLGRMDDLIVVRGANYVPEDLELAIQRSNPALQPDGGAAFAVEFDGEPYLVVAHELQRSALNDLDGRTVVKSILRAVSEQYELEVMAVVLLKPRTLPRTHSGKKTALRV